MDSRKKPTQGVAAASTVKRLFAEEFSPYTRVLIVLLAVATVVGTIDSLHDGAGERLLGGVPLVAPSIVGVWVALELIWRKAELPLQARLFIACLVAPLPNALFSTVCWGAFGLSGYGQDLIATAAEGQCDHYYWPRDARGPGVIGLMLFGSYGVAGAMALLTTLVVALPAIGYLRSHDLLAGTDLRTDGRHLKNNVFAARCLFGALSVGTLAAIVWAADLSTPLALGLGLVAVVLIGVGARFATRR